MFITENLANLWTVYRPPFLFELVFISLLFLRPSKSYDFQAFLAVAFGIFIAYAFQVEANPVIRALVHQFYDWSSIPIVVSLIFFFIGIRQFSEKSFFYPEVLDNIIENPFGLFLLSLFLAFYNHLAPSFGLPPHFKMLFLQDIILWTLGGCIIVTIKNTLPENFLRRLFGIIVIFLGAIMLFPRILPFSWMPYFYF